MESSQRRRLETVPASTVGQGRRTQSSGSPSVKNLRKPRHAGLFDALHRLDTGLDPATRDELARWIRDQYTVEYGDIPLGFVSRCYLGPPYVDHWMDLMHNILDHFSAGQAMPEPFEGARMLARASTYAFIEVYASGRLIPVMEDGTPVVMDATS